MSIDDVTDVSPRVRYVAAAAQDEFDYPFPIFQAADLVVDIDGVIQALTTDYTVDGEGEDLGGTVTLVSPLDGDEIVTIYRDTVIERVSDQQQNGPYASSTFNDEFDKAYTIMQELKAKIGRAIRFPFSAATSDAQAELSPLSNWLGKLLYIGDDGVLEPAEVTDDLTVLSQSVLAEILHPITAAEQSAGVTPVDYSIQSHEKCGYFMPERYAVNTTPGTTVMQTAVERAIAVAVAAGGGTVLLSDRYKMSGALATAAGVDIVGMGQGAALEFSGSHGVTFAWTTGFGSVTLDNFQVIGGGTGNYYGIYQIGTLSNADELYGLTIRNMLITYWNVGISLRTVRNLFIDNNWIQNVDRGIELIGAILMGHVAFNKATRGAGGGGAGDDIGVEVDGFTYTTLGGFQPPEGIQFIANQIYGFETCYYIGFINFCNIVDGDVAGEVYGIDFSTAQLGFTVRDVYFDMVGADVVAGIYGRGLASPANSKINISGCTFNATNTVTAYGVKINDSGNQNQSFVTVADCYFTGFTSGDIIFNNAGPGAIINNRCASSAPTYSINIPNVVLGPVIVRDNLCTKGFNYGAAEAAAGEVLVGPNVVSGATLLNVPGYWVTPAFAAGNFTGSDSQTWTVASGDVTTYAYEIVGNKMTVLFSIDTTTVGGTPSGGLQIAIPASKVAAKETYTTVFVSEGGTRAVGTAHVVATGTVIVIQKIDASNWAAATNTTYVKGQITFEIQ